MTSKVYVYYVLRKVPFYSKLSFCTLCYVRKFGKEKKMGRKVKSFLFFSTKNDLFGHFWDPLFSGRRPEKFFLVIFQHLGRGKP